MLICLAASYLVGGLQVCTAEARWRQRNSGQNGVYRLVNIRSNKS